MIRTASQRLLNVTSRLSGIASVRNMTHYPIDDVMFGLTSEQIGVSKNVMIMTDKSSRGKGTKGA